MSKRFFASLLSLVVLLAGLLPSPAVDAAPAPATAPHKLAAPAAGPVILDGYGDASYGPPLASDAAGDLASPGPADWYGTLWTDLTALYVTNDTQNLYVFVPLPAYDSAAGSGSTGSFALVLATGQYTATGGTVPTDPWGSAITLAYTATHANVGEPPMPLAYRIIPDRILRGNIVGRDCCGYSDNGWTELRRWNGSDYATGAGSNWGGLSGGAMVSQRIAFASGSGVEFAIPFSDLGVTFAADLPIHLQFYATQTGPSKGAYDTVPSDDQSTGWDDPTTQRFLATYALVSTQDVILTAPAEGAHFVRAPIAVTGYVTPTGQVTVTLSLNGTATFTPTLDAQGTFTQSITLSPGANTLTATAVSLVGIGRAVRHVTYGPLVTITAPYEGQHFIATVADVTGVAAPAEDVTVTVDVNGTVYTPTVDPLSGAFSQTVALNNGLNTITVIAANASGSDSDTVHVTQGSASHDNDVWWGCLGHNTRDLDYRDPFGARPAGSTVTLRLRACAGDLTGVTFHGWPANLSEIALPMAVSSVITDPTGAHEYWEVEVTLPVTPTILFYKFEVADGSDVDWYLDDVVYDGRNGWGRASDDNPYGDAFDLTVYDASFTTPDWIKNGIIYQIFPDRFRDGEPANNVISGTHFVYAPDRGITYTTWNSAVLDPRAAGPLQNRWSEDFYGGDLQGVTEKLDYLQSLGVTALYLNPIFLSPSNHKYDTTDFGRVDPHLGGEAAFEQLIAAAQARGMVVVLDGVFNHTSSDSVYFDKYSRWDADGNPTALGLDDDSGAYESMSSPYFDWYTFNNWPDDYEMWWIYDTLPRLRSGQAEVRAYFWGDGNASIGGRWVVSGTHGWRLDVGGDVDGGAWYDPHNTYWEGFRQTVKAANAEAVIFGEEWGDARSWLLGREWDSVMNYRFRSALLSFLRDRVYWDNDNNANSSGGTLYPITVSQFDRWLHQIQEDYPPEAWYAMVNLVGSHDTNRVRFVLSKWQKGYDDSDPLPYDPATDLTVAETDARQKLMAILQFTMPGAPTIYYGDEVGLEGRAGWYNDKWEDDPYNRVPFPWEDTPGYYQARPGMAEHYALLGAIRNRHPALRTGSFDTLLIDDANALYAYGRRLGDDVAVVVINRDAAAHTVTVDVSGYLADGTVLADALNGGTYAVGSGQIVVSDLDGLWGAILVPPAPALSLDKAVFPVDEVDLGEAVVYTITLHNSGDGAAEGVVLTDTLPAGVTFGGWIEQSGAAYNAGVVTWRGDLPASAGLTIVFTATVDMDWALHGQTLTNTVTFSSLNGGAGQAQAAFTVRPLSTVYLPLVMRP